MPLHSDTLFWLCPNLIKIRPISCSIQSMHVGFINNLFYFLISHSKLVCHNFESILQREDLRILKRSFEKKVKWSVVRSYMQGLNGTIDRSNFNKNDSMPTICHTLNYATTLITTWLGITPWPSTWLGITPWPSTWLRITPWPTAFEASIHKRPLSQYRITEVIMIYTKNIMNISNKEKRLELNRMLFMVQLHEIGEIKYQKNLQSFIKTIT